MKRKLVYNKKSIVGTGGGPNREVPLSALEEDVSALLSLGNTVEGEAGESSFGLRNPFCSAATLGRSTTLDVSASAATSDPSTLTAVDEFENGEGIGTEYTNTPRQTPRKRRAEDVNESLDLLKRQVCVQEKMQQSIENGLHENKKYLIELVAETRKKRKVLEKFYDLHKTDMEDKRRHALEMEQIQKEKLEVKRKKLELQFTQI